MYGFLRSYRYVRGRQPGGQWGRELEHIRSRLTLCTLPFGVSLRPGRDKRPGDHIRVALPWPHHRKHIGVLVDHDFEECRPVKFYKGLKFVLEFAHRSEE